MKHFFTILAIIHLSQIFAQVSTVFPLVAKDNVSTVFFSLNERYALLTDVSFPKSEVNVSIYDVTQRKPLRNLTITLPEDMEPVFLSNDGTLISFFRNTGYGYNYIYDLNTNKITENGPESVYYLEPFDKEDMIKKFNPENNHWTEEKLWFSKKYLVTIEKKFLVVYDSLSNVKQTFPISCFPELRNYYKNYLSVSETGKYIAYNSMSRIYVYHPADNKMIINQEIGMSSIQGLTINDNGVLCIAGNHFQEKSAGLHWFEVNTQKYLAHSTEDQLLNLTYCSQFYKFLTLGLGKEESKRVQNSQFIDLSSGQFSELRSGKGWFSFDDLQLFVRDTLCKTLLSDAVYHNIRDSKIYPTYWKMRADYMNDQDRFDPAIKNPQIDTTFFKFMDGTGWNINVITCYENKVTYVNTTGDLPFFGMVLQNKVVYFWNSNKHSAQESLVKLVFTKDFKPVFYCDDNYYFCPLGMVDVIGFEYDFKYYPAEQFDLKYNRPDIILDRLGYADSSLIAAYHEAYQKRIKKMGFTEEMLQDDFHLPEIKIENFEELPTKNDGGSIDLKLNLQDDKYKLDRVNVWVNDVAIYGTDGISLRDKDVQKYSMNLNVALAKGNNKVQVSVLNRAGAESYKETFEIECSKGKDKPDLYLITIGASKYQQSNYNLTYASKDASDIAETFSKSKVYDNVNIKTLINEEVTKENILDLRAFLEEADINDEVMIFIAGHGLLDAKLDYYFATYDMDFQQPQERGVAYEDLEGLLDGIKPLKKTLLIDACHSGEIDKDEVMLAQTETVEDGNIQFRAVGNTATPKLGVQNTSELTKLLFTDLRKGTGATVISSAGGMEFAMEGDDWNNGLFTYCLIKGIQSKEADLNEDGEIWLSEIQQYVAQQVTELSNGKQQPTSRIENQTVDFRVW